MACTIKFTVNNKTWEITSDLLSPSSYILSQDFVNALNDPSTIIKNSDGKNSNWEEINDYIYKINSNNIKPINNISIDKLTGSKNKGYGLMGNCNISYLKTLFPDKNIDWGDVSDDIEILLVDNLRIDTKSPYGHIYYNEIDENGKKKIKELYIIRNTKYNIEKLAEYLKLVNLIDNLDISINMIKEDIDQLEEIIKIYNKNHRTNKITDIKLLLKNYILNSDKFKGLQVNNIYVSPILDGICRTLRNVGQRKNYKTDFVNALHLLFIYGGKNNTYAKLNIEDFLIIAKNEYSEEIKELIDISKSKTLQLKDFTKLLSSKYNDNKELIDKVFGNLNYSDDTLIADIILNQWIFFKEPTLNYKFDKIAYGKIEFKSNPKPISAYGITYDHIANFAQLEELYKGYRIYTRINDETGETEYIPSKYHLNENTFTKIFSTQEEAEMWIDDKVNNEVIAKASLFNLKFRLFDEHKVISNELEDLEINLSTKIAEGTIVDSIDIALDPTVITKIKNGKEKYLIGDRNAKIEDFIEYINNEFFKERSEDLLSIQNKKSYILENINTPEKIGIFIWKLNLDIDNRETPEFFNQIDTIIDEINNASQKQYYIHKVSPVSHTTTDLFGYAYKTKVIPTTTGSVSYKSESINYKTNKRTPILTTLFAIQKVFDNKYGVKVNLLTSSELLNIPECKGIDLNNTKAFILNGEIYINSDIANPEDALHEYTHLLLGVLKSNSESRSHYLELLGMILKTSQGQAKLNELSRKRPDVKSQIDLAEEVFADLFGEYVMRNLSKLDKDVVDIFLTKDKDQKTLANKVESIFTLSSGETLSSIYNKSFERIMMQFNKDVHDLLANNESFSFASTIESRKVTKWIEDLIDKKLIDEHDCE